MKNKKKAKARRHTATRPYGMQKTRVVSKSSVRRTSQPKNTYTPMETGEPDQEQSPGYDNPGAAQGGLGPLNQEGEGNRQNDELAELEQIEPEE